MVSRIEYDLEQDRGGSGARHLHLVEKGFKIIRVLG